MPTAMYPKACFCVRITRGEGFFSKECFLGTSLVVQWLGLCDPNAGAMGSIPGQGTEIPHATQHSQCNDNSNNNKHFLYPNCGPTDPERGDEALCMHQRHTHTNTLIELNNWFFFFSLQEMLFIILCIQPYSYEHFFFNILAAQNTLYSVPHLAFGT